MTTGDCFRRDTIRVVQVFVAVSALSLAVGCGDEVTRPTATATPTPSPTPANRAPTVVLSGVEACHPLCRSAADVTACTITLEADAEDPDGDALSYAWSGCASGAARMARCSIDRLAAFTATVTVSDGKGHDVTASKTIRGVNATPMNETSFHCYYGPYESPAGTCPPSQQPDCPPVPTGTYVDCMSMFVNPVYDQEGDEIRCDEVVASGSGCRRGGFYECGGIADAASFDLRTPDSPTVCTYEAYMRDSWGARFRVATIRLPVLSR